MNRKESEAWLASAPGFIFTIPSTYDYSFDLEMFRANYGKEFGNVSPSLWAKNFPDPSTILKPGETYEIRMPFLKAQTGIACINILKENNVILVGVHGLALMWKHKRENFPEGLYVVSFDEITSLIPDSFGYPGVPGIALHPVTGWDFELGNVYDHFTNVHILCFLKK